ncbi:MAG: zf-HC2 domain-containing protein [Pirellulaceae bacterium]|nr:zf-HC2 domain-containing protein [Pirellulaceae bacterium]
MPLKCYVIAHMDQRDDYTLELLSAYVDNELSPDERIAVEQLLARDADSRRWLDEIRAVASGVALLPRFHLDASLAERVIEQAAVPGVPRPARCDEVRSPSAGSARPAAAWSRRHAVAGWTAVAACLALSWFLWLRREDPAATGQVGPLAAVPESAEQSHRARAGAPREGVQVVANSPGDHLARESVDAPRVPESTVAADVLGEPASRVPPTPQAPAASLPDASGAELATAPDRDLTPAENGAAARMGSASAAPDGSRAQGPPPTDSSDLADDGKAEPDWTAKVPVSSSLQLLLVIDITLTPQGHEHSAFERTLVQHGVALEETAVVDATLEESLLASRFFDPREALGNDVPPPRLALLYVQALGRQVDGVWRTLQSQPAHCNSVSLDLAILADDVAMFRDLRRVIQQQSGRAAAVADNRDQQRRATAHRLALSPHWRGTPAYKLRGAKELAGLVPDWMLGDAASSAARLPGVPGQPALETSRQAGQQLGENLDVEALFVVH